MGSGSSSTGMLLGLLSHGTSSKSGDDRDDRNASNTVHVPQLSQEQERGRWEAALAGASHDAVWRPPHHIDDSSDHALHPTRHSHEVS